MRKPTLYQVHTPGGPFEVVRADELDGAKFVREERSRPEDPALPTYRLYCHGGACDAREVTVECKHYDGVPEKPPAMRCPLCGGPLEHRGYVEEEMLVPHEGA